MAKVAVAEVVAGSMRDSTSLVRTVTPGVIGVSLTVVLIALLLMRDYRRLEERTNVRGQQRLARSAARFQSLVENSADVIMVIHSTRGMSYASPASRRILGYEPSELMTISRDQLVHSDDLALYSAARDRCGGVPGSLVGPLELRLRHRDDTWRCMQVSLSNHLDDPTVEGFVVNAHDITDLKAAEADLVHGVTHDSLTGLPNRTLFLDRLSVSVARSDRRAATALVMVCGVDGFKLINESLGLPAGDAVLVTVGQRIRAAMRPADTVARFGGDEFVICCENVVDEQDAHAFACRVIRALDKPINVDGNEVFVTVSVGVRLAPATATVDGLDDILRDADVAMYQAKREGRGGIEIFSEPLGERTQRRLEIESGLHHALERDEFRVHYQPTMSIHDGRFTGVEALVRWEHPGRGMRAPGDFIGIAEETGLIVPIGLWVLDEACQQLHRWNELGSGPMTMAVNLSPRQLSSPQLVDRVAEIIARSRVRPEDLTLEITENALMQDVAAAEIVLRALKALGLRLAIDDFGTGYSSLGYLRRFPIDILKIDQSFVAQLGTDAHSTAIVTSVIHLATALDLDVVAEGVETREQLAQLELLGCQLAQGYYWSKPVPPDEITLGLKLTGAASSITEMSGDGKIRVLVADDEASHRAAVKRILERSDRFTVVAEAVDGREAVRMAQQERPDLVVLDLSMPNMGGLEALPRILASSPGTKVALLSGHAGDPTVAEGASHHLRKGAKPAELVEDLLLVMGAAPSADG
jgi:diguanylate cyclase (GGDEF)-like protein/PAS domain S-box-containing protein